MELDVTCSVATVQPTFRFSDLPVEIQCYICQLYYADPWTIRIDVHSTLDTWSTSLPEIIFMDNLRLGPSALCFVSRHMYTLALAPYHASFDGTLFLHNKEYTSHLPHKPSRVSSLITRFGPCIRQIKLETQSLCPRALPQILTQRVVDSFCPSSEVPRLMPGLTRLVVVYTAYDVWSANPATPTTFVDRPAIMAGIQAKLAQRTQLEERRNLTLPVDVGWTVTDTATLVPVFELTVAPNHLLSLADHWRIFSSRFSCCRFLSAYPSPVSFFSF